MLAWAVGEMGMRENKELRLEWECASSGCDKIGFAHLVRSRGGAAFEQPIAAQSFGYFVIAHRSSELGDGL